MFRPQLRSRVKAGPSALVGLTLAIGLLAACGSGHPDAHASAPSPVTSSASPTTAPASTPAAPSPTTSPVGPNAEATRGSVQPAAPAAATPQALPVSGDTGSATQVVTVLAASESTTSATLQTWNKVAGGWVAATAPITAHLGSAGLSPHPSEGSTHTPMGSFSLTQAFGHDANPGTALPYRQTDPDDWWISEPGPLYNTEQNCASGCAFDNNPADPKNMNEHLYYETPYYNYAVVIDYNTANAGPVVQGAGSAFFLHVTDGKPTAGCVAIAQSNLVSIMKWLNPADSPRILMGTG